MISPAMGRIFEKSSTPLRTWFYAMFRASTATRGITAKQLQREIGVTYKTAWRMMSRIRGLLAATCPMDPRVDSAPSPVPDRLLVRADVRLLILFRRASDRDQTILTAQPLSAQSSAGEQIPVGK